MGNMHNLPFSSAAERNRRPIFEELKHLLPDAGTVLEIGSGTGQHVAFVAEKLPGLTWQPSDRQENLAGLENRLAKEGNPRMLPPLKLDVLVDRWPDDKFVAAYSANTAHIMSWKAVVAMFEGVGNCLLEGARFCLYGPFNIDGEYTAESNRQFDLQLRARDPRMGLRDMGDVEKLAKRNQMTLEMKIAMPANNYLLVFKKS
jgi:cyclopropane fatty-acyl-phospholipid synthase-like methyltransferase